MYQIFFPSLQLLPFLLLPLRASARSILFENGTVVSFNEETQTPLILRETSILITDDRVAAIFASSNKTVDIADDAERIRAEGDIIIPGFIDTHRHVWQTVHRTLGANATLAEYLTRWSNTTLTSQIYDGEIMYASELMGLYEAINAGVTTLVDHGSGSFSEEVTRAGHRALIDSGIRGVFALQLGAKPGNFTLERQMAVWREFAAPEQVQGSLISMGIAYETFDIGTPKEIQTVIDFIRGSNTSLLETHYVGGVMGNANSPALLAGLGLLNLSFPVVFVHGNSITPTDAAYLRDHNQYISTALEFELHHGSDVSKLPLISDQASLSVGTHYAQSGDILTQARLWLQAFRGRVLEGELVNWRVPANNPISANQAFLLATRSGGLALRRPDLGVLRVGAKADIVVFDGNAPGMLGWVDPVAAVVMHSNVGHIKHVLIDGQWRKRNGQIQNLDYAQARERFLDAARKVQAFWERLPRDTLDGQWLTGSPFSVVQEFDVVRGEGTGY